MTNKTVSVIIPTYNRKDLLTECIDSLLKQSYPKEDYEIIIIDDGSTDGTEKIIQTLISANNYDISYHRKERGGPSSALNLGIKKAGGKILAFIDDDAITKENWLKEATTLIDKENIAILEGKIETIVEKISPFTHQNEKHEGGRYETINIFYTRKALNDIGVFDEDFWDDKIKTHFRYDSDMAFRALEKGYKIFFSSNVMVVNPPTEPSLITPFKLAARYYFDPLLFKKHPIFYRHRLQVLKINNFYIARPKQKLYKLYIFSFLFLLFFLIIKSKIGVTISGLAFFLFYITTFIIHLRIWRTGHMRPRDFILSMPIFAIIPFFYIYWLINGMIKFKKVILW